jgi:hypothetical protein
MGNEVIAIYTALAGQPALISDIFLWLVTGAVGRHA